MWSSTTRMVFSSGAQADPGERVRGHPQPGQIGLAGLAEPLPDRGEPVVTGARQRAAGMQV
jgi:hypothetical protein